jgi:drug/metabolite transporter (DMT)-like permease
LALFVVALIYGGNYSIAKVVMDDGYLPPLGFIFLRVLTGTLLFFLVLRIGPRERIQKADYLRLALCGLFGVAINQMFFFLGLNQTSPIHASLIMTTTPILVLIASSILIGERITPLKVLGIALGAVGAILLILQGKSVGADGSSAFGDLLVFINASSYGIYLVLVKKLMRRYRPTTVIAWVFLFGLLFVTPFGLPTLSKVDWSSFTPLIWVAVGYVLLLTTFLVYLLNAFALSVVQASVVSIYIYLQPLFAALIAILWQQDQLDGRKLLAASLIFLGVYLVSRPRKKLNPPTSIA